MDFTALETSLLQRIRENSLVVPRSYPAVSLTERVIQALKEQLGEPLTVKQVYRLIHPDHGEKDSRSYRVIATTLGRLSRPEHYRIDGKVIRTERGLYRWAMDLPMIEQPERPFACPTCGACASCKRPFIR